VAKTAIRLGQVVGLPVSADRSAFIGSAVLWMLASGFSLAVLRQSLVVALMSGLLALVLHWCGVIWHQLGHAWAARRAGYPMTGIRLWHLLSTSIYPTDELPLPQSVHIRRALGGPVASLALTFVAGLLALTRSPFFGPYWWVLVFFFLDNLLVFALGSLLPLGFTDGSTLLRLRRDVKRSAPLNP
jgi:Zn-dependent protease